jgi:hypothetical protein
MTTPSPPGPDDSALAKAEQHAESASPEPADAPVTPCPLRDRWALEVLVLGTDDKGVSGVAVRLERSPDSVSSDVTGVTGLVRFDGLQPGSYQVCLPELDAAAWRPGAAEALPEDKARSSGDHSWSAPEPPSDPKTSWTIELGDCLASVAFDLGFAQDTIWTFGGNAGLRKVRTTGYDLQSGDILQIPPKRVKKIAAQVKNRYPIRLVDVPERLKVRFVRFNMKPKSGEPYLLHVETAEGSPRPDKQGTTDGGGFLEEPIPPNAISANVLLGKKPHIEEHTFRLGAMNPGTEIGGMQRRLLSLGYLDEVQSPGIIDEPTRMALQRLQSDYKLNVTGEWDGPTKGKIEELFLS